MPGSELPSAMTILLRPRGRTLKLPISPLNEPMVLTQLGGGCAGRDGCALVMKRKKGIERDSVRQRKIGFHLNLALASTS